MFVVCNVSPSRTFSVCLQTTEEERDLEKGLEAIVVVGCEGMPDARERASKGGRAKEAKRSILTAKKEGRQPGFEPGTSRIREMNSQNENRNH